MGWQCQATIPLCHSLLGVVMRWGGWKKQPHSCFPLKEKPWHLCLVLLVTTLCFGVVHLGCLFSFGSTLLLVLIIIQGQRTRAFFSSLGVPLQVENISSSVCFVLFVVLFRLWFFGWGFFEGGLLLLFFNASYAKKPPPDSHFVNTQKAKFSLCNSTHP